MNATREAWKPVTGYEGYYEVSDHGRIRSLDRIDRSGRRCKGIVRRPYIGTHGYKVVSLCVDRVTATVLVHRTVLRAFSGEPVGDANEVRHLDGDQLNNRLGNLVWGTRSENNLDKVRHGTHHEIKKEMCPRGHGLRYPNLDKSLAKRGKRVCLACVRAFSNIQYHPEWADVFQEISDGQYDRVIRGVKGRWDVANAVAEIRLRKSAELKAVVDGGFES